MALVLRWLSLGIAPDPSAICQWSEIVILVDSFIAAHRVQHKNVEIDFLSISCIPGLPV